MGSKSGTNQPLNLADVYRQVDYVLQEKSPYLTYYENDHIFNPQLVREALRSSQVDSGDEVGRLKALEEDIHQFEVTLSLLKLSLAHLFDTVTKPNYPNTNLTEFTKPPPQHNRESPKLSLSTLRSLTGKRHLYYEVSTVYDRVQGWRLDLIRQHYELSKSLQVEGEDTTTTRSDFFLPESLKNIALTHPTNLSPDVNPIADFETSLGAITSSNLTRIVKKLLPTRPTPINLKAPTTTNNRTEQTHRSSKPIKKNGDSDTNYRPDRPNHNPSNKPSKVELPSSPVALSDSDDQTNPKEGKNSFMSANTYLKLSSKRSPSEIPPTGSERPNKKSATHDGPNQPFINPLRKKVTETTKSTTSRENSFKKPHPSKPSPASDLSDDEIENERLKNIDPQMVERIKNEIMVGTENLTMDSIAGLDHAKKMVREITILPLQRPDLFTGLRRPPKGVLLFGPPGTGKTLIGKCIASQGGATFFSISSSSLTSKWIGDGEKMVRALFAVARCYQPAVVFVDEIDSLLTQRTDNEVEASRRIKTEFLVQFDGCSSLAEDRILIIGATNRPQEIDEAARRRFMKRVYIPLPELAGRRKIVSNLLAKNHHDLTLEEFDQIAHLTEGYSGSDMDGLCREAALGPIRSITDFDSISHSQIRPISFPDFLDALKQVRASVDPRELDFYSEWNAKFGTLS